MTTASRELTDAFWNALELIRLGRMVMARKRGAEQFVGQYNKCSPAERQLAVELAPLL